jgi:hypothetical protein
MSFAERAKAKPKPIKTLDEWLTTLPKDEHDAVTEMLTSPDRWTIVEMVDELRAEGHRFGKDQVSRWRKANNVVRK